jgi:hypothetical protein
VKPNKLAFGNMEDCLQNDKNWKRVIGATSYAGMLFGWGTFVFFSSISDRGLNFGLKTWLIVSSSQSLFYGLLWCFVHGCIVFRHSIVFVWHWTRPSLSSGWLLCVRQLITVTVLSSTLLFLYLASWLYSAVFVTYLAFVLGSIFSVITFLGYQSYKLLLPSSPLFATIRPFPSPFPSAHRLAQSKIAETLDRHASPGGTRRQASALLDDSSPMKAGRSVSGAEEALNNPSRISRFMMYVSFASLLMIVIGVTLLAVVVRMLVFPDQVPNTWYYYYDHLHHTITTSTIAPNSITAIIHRSSSVATSGGGIEVAIDMRYGDAVFNSGTIRVSNDTKGAVDPFAFKKLQSHVCDLNVVGYTAAEAIIFAQMAYLGVDDARSVLAALFPDLILVPTRLDGDRVYFYEIVDNAHNTSVVTVRGTTVFDFVDWLADMDEWLEAGVFQLFATVLPGLSLWPHEARSQVLPWCSDVGCPTESDNAFNCVVILCSPP